MIEEKSVLTEIKRPKRLECQLLNRLFYIVLLKGLLKNYRFIDIFFIYFFSSYLFYFI